MTRVGGPGARAEAPHRVAAVHEHGGRWRVVIVQNRTGWTFLEAASLSQGDGQGLQDLLRRHRVEELVRIAPSEQTICKSVVLPPGDQQTLDSALSLMMEAQLPDSIPGHRRAAGIIPDRRRSDGSTGLLIGWRLSAGEEFSPLVESVEETWTAPIACLAALGGSGPVTAYVDEKTGVVAVIARGESRTLARVLIGSSGGTSGANAAVAETCRAVGVDEAGSIVSGLHLEPTDRDGLNAAVKNLPRKPEWNEEFGLALGAALVALSDNPSTRRLAGMHAVAPEDRISLAECVTNWLSAPGRAYAASTVAMLALLLAPVAIAAIRANVLGARSAALQQFEQSRDELARQAALYQALEQTRWPMSKLLADVAGATPVGVVVEGLRLSPELGLGLDGTAETIDQLTQLQANFNRTGPFRDARIDRSESTPEGVKFTFTARVTNPHVSTELGPEADFSARPLAVRMYGEGASNTAYTSAEAPRGRRDRPGLPSAGARPPDRPGGGSSEGVPAPLSDAEISAMDRSTAGRTWAERKKYLQTNPRLDQATKARLDAEIDKLFARFRSATGGGS